MAGLVHRSGNWWSDLQSLTEFERDGLAAPLGLADGHAYQDLSLLFRPIVDGLTYLWDECERTTVPEMEQRFRKAFALLAKSSGMANLKFFKICPTASNAIDIVGAVLADRGLSTHLLEPTFDNLALILQRRQVRLVPLSEKRLSLAVKEETIPELLDQHPCGALFLVQPNNPTGRSLDATSLRIVANYCAKRDVILLLDNSFRFYHRLPFDDYALLAESGVSFMAIEDTGKVWPTHDLKASLLFCSPDLERIVATIYNEIFLCHSRLALAVLEQFLLRTVKEGLASTVWTQVDEHRAALRSAIVGTDLVVDETALDSQISVEWLDCRRTGWRDLELVARLAAKGLFILPGRQFFWHSRAQSDHQYNIRFSLMKPHAVFAQSMAILQPGKSQPAPNVD